MAPSEWRKQARLRLADLATHAGCASASSVMRYERGDREAPNSVVLAYQHLSKGLVTGEDFAAVRARYLADQPARRRTEPPHSSAA